MEAVLVTVPLVVVLVDAVLVVVERYGLDAVVVLTGLGSVAENLCPMMVIELIGLMVKRPILFAEDSAK